MSIFILSVNIGVIVCKIFMPRIIRRIDVDYIYFTCVSIGKLRQSSKVVALDDEVVGSVGIIGDYRVYFIIVALDEDREVFAKAFLNVFWLFFPNKPILLMSSYEFEQRGLFLVA